MVCINTIKNAYSSLSSSTLLVSAHRSKLQY